MNKLTIEKIDNNKYRIILKLPLANAWYDDVIFYYFNSNMHCSIKLNHKDNLDNSIKFENIIELPDSALYNTFISCKIDGETFYLDKDNNWLKSIEKKDMKKISSNFYVPEWSKGAIIYHIFVDRFNRSNTDKLINKPRKSIHYDLSEEPLIGPDNNGIWTNDFYGGDIKGIIEKLDYFKKLKEDPKFLGYLVNISSVSYIINTSLL